MKTIGLLGGMSWESTVGYYKIINEEVKRELGGLHSAKCILYSVDFDVIEQYQHNGEWDKALQILIDASKSIEKAGADFMLICTNTMHKLAEPMQQAIHIPILHIAEATASNIIEKQIKRVGLLGTKFTMEEDFYTSIIQNSGIEVIIPEKEERDIVHSVIYNELCLGKTEHKSKDLFIQIMEHLVRKGAEGIILGCTEISMLIKENDVEVPLFDTTAIHAKEAVRKALHD